MPQPTIEEIVQIAAQLKEAGLENSIGPTVRAMGITLTDKELDRIIARASATATTAEKRTELRLLERQREPEYKAATKLAVGRAGQTLEAEQLAAASRTARQQLARIETAALGILTADPERIIGPTVIEDQLKRIDAMADRVPEAPEIAAQLRTDAKLLGEQNKARERAKISAASQRYGVKIDSVRLDELASGAVENPGRAEDVQTTIRALHREKVMARLKGRGKQGILRGLRNQSVIDTMEGKLADIQASGGEAMGEAAAAPFRMVKGLRAEIPKAKLMAGAKKYGKAGALGIGAALILPTILKSIFGGGQDAEPEGGMTQQQKFQLMMQMAGNKGGGQQGGMGIGREILDMQRLMNLIETIKQSQGLMAAPVQTGGFA